jgi:hypothetical protein
MDSGLNRPTMTPDDRSILPPRDDGLDEAELTNAPLEGIEFLLALATRVGGIGVSWSTGTSSTVTVGDGRTAPITPSV